MCSNLMNKSYPIERPKNEFGPAYNLFESTLLVPAGSKLATLADANRAGVRVVGIQNTTTIRSAIRALNNATVIPARSVDVAVEMIRSGQADALALSRNSLQGLVARLPGARILDGHFHAASTAIAVAKNRPAALAYVSAFIEDAKASGLVRRALDEVGLKEATVAPPGAR